ncbi:hypothetical protein FRB97_004750 [Tulasnella sp. 331]|nr:hypothetical protein FRB97_004750 [Tulasnella sp. 331]
MAALKHSEKDELEDFSRSTTTIQPARAQWLWKLLRELDVESRGIVPTLPEERVDHRYLKIFFIWLSANCNILSFSAGTVGPILFGLSFKHSAAVIVGFNLIGLLLPGYFSTFGPKLGMRQMVQSRYSWGYFGAIVPATLNAATMMGFMILNCVLGGETLASVSNGRISWNVGIVVIAVVSLFISFCGYRVLNWYERVAWIPILVIFVIMLGVGGKHLSNVPPEAAPPTARQIMSFGSSIIGFVVSYCALSSDFATYLRIDTPSWKVFLSSYLGLLLPVVLVQILGAAFAVALASVPNWTAGYDSYSVGGLIKAILLSAGHGFGGFLTVIMALSVTANVAPTLYSSSLNIQIIFPPLGKLPRYAFSVVATAILIPVSIVGKTRFYLNLYNFLGIVGYWSAMFASVVVVEHWLIRRGCWEKGYDAAAWNRWKELPMGLAALSASVGSCALVWAVMDQGWWVGPIAKTTGDIGFESRTDTPTTPYDVFMQSESTVTARRTARSLGLSVFNPDNSSDDDHPNAVPRKQLPPKPLPTPNLQPQQYLQQQTPQLLQSSQSLQQPPSQYYHQHQRQPSYQPVHSASSSTSSISINTSAPQHPLNGNGGNSVRNSSTSNNTYSQSSPTSQRYASTYMSSSSSRSSPAMDSTPPPTTPASTLPPVSLVGDNDRWMEGLGLNVNEMTSNDNDYVSHRNNDPPRGGPMSNYTHVAVTAPTPSPAPESRTSTSLERLIITATADAEYYAIVDITGATDAAFIRERIFSKLRIPDEEHHCYSIYRTEFGEAALGDPVTDDQLMIYCAEWADGKGTLKFLVQRKPDAPPLPFVPPAHVHSPPPPVSPANNSRNNNNVNNSRPSPQGGGDGSIPSTTSDRDRPPWDRNSNGYEGDVDGRQQQLQQLQQQPLPPLPQQAQQQPQQQQREQQQPSQRVGRLQSPPSIDTNTPPSRRRREPSASSSDSYNFSPSSPSGSSATQYNNQPPPVPSNNIGSNGSVPRRGGTTPTPPSFMVSSTPPSQAIHRRQESEAAAQEREQALEASERMQETQRKEYDAQIRRIKVDRDRQSRRQTPMHVQSGSMGSLQEAIPPVPPVPSAYRSHRSDSLDSDAPMKGWVMVNEVQRESRDRDQQSQREQALPSSVPQDTPLRPAFPIRSGSFSSRGDAANGPNGWNPATPSHMASPPAESPRFSPSQQTLPAPSRPYPHSTGTPHSQVFPSGPLRSASNGGNSANVALGSVLSPTTPLQRSHPPLPTSSRYPNPHPHPPHSHSRSGAQPLPPGASDPRMRIIDQRTPPVGLSGFYPPSIPLSYSGSTPSRIMQTGSGSSGGGTGNSGEVGSPPSSRLVHSAKSIPDLRGQYNPPSSGMRSNVSSAQLPVGRRPTALPSGLMNDSVGLYGGMGRTLPPLSPGRLPPPSPNRPIISPSSFYNSGNNARSPATPSGLGDYGSSGSGISRSLGGMATAAQQGPPSAGLFSSGVFADAPLGGRPLRTKQSFDKSNPSGYAGAQRFGWQGGNGPSPSSTLKVNTTPQDQQQQPQRNGSMGGSRPPSDGDLGDGVGQQQKRSSPSEMDSTPAQALSKLEMRRPTVPSLVTGPAAPGSFSSSLDSKSPISATMSPISSIMSADGTLVQIPQAVVTPSSPMEVEGGHGTLTGGNDNQNGNGGRSLSGYQSFPSGVASPAISATSSQELTDDGSEGTLRPENRAHWMSMMGGSDNDADGESNGSGTMKPRGVAGMIPQPPSAVTGTAKRVSVRRAKARSIKAKSRELSALSAAATGAAVGASVGAGAGAALGGGAIEDAPRTSSPAQVETGELEEEEDEEWSDDDEDDDDDRFWNTSATPTPAASRSPRVDEEDGSGTMTQDMAKQISARPLSMSRGPSLTVQITTPIVDDRNSPLGTPAASEMPLSSGSTQQSLTPSEAMTPGGLGVGGIDRRASFRRDTWAFRPKAEEVYDHLQDFFPDHDLDKTFIDPISGGISPTDSPPAVPAPTAVKENKFRHRKSIRIVAEERKKALDRISTTGKDQSANTKAANIARKRSTKLWGSKIEEVTPSQMKGGPMPTVPESPTGAAPVRPTIKWVKGDLIGKGTYGKVFLALNATTGEMLAVKQVEMPQSVSDQDDQRQVGIVNAIKAERDTLERLDHPNIVQYLGFEQTTEFFNVFLEYVPGGSIGSCLRKQGKFDEDVVRLFTGQIVDGLAYLHANKIIHRDVKADNVLVDPTGTCKISDFGISKRSDEIYNNAAMTAMQGSLFWMAPEMLHNNKKGYNAKIDIWSLGCVFIEMFAGRRPWEQDDFVSVMFKVGHNKMAPPVPEDVHLSPEADDFRLKCFAEDPAERPTAEGLKSHPWLVLPFGYHFTGFH